MSDFENTLNNILSSPEEMEKIAKLAQSIMGGDGAAAAPGMEGVDMASLQSMMGMMSQGGESYGLLEAIKPHLAEKRRAKIDKAMQIARLAKVARVAFKNNPETK